MKPNPFSNSLRVLAMLLSYPDQQQLAHAAELSEVLHEEGALGATRLREMDALLSSLAKGNALDIEAHYVEIFDQGRATSLHLFEHVHGDSRDRGPAMIDLTQTYEKAGLFLAPEELPDYLPVVLEFVSTQPPAEARAFLGEMAHIFNAIFNALAQRESAYASALGALLELAGEKAHAVKIVPDEPIDTSWAEPDVFGGCSTKGQARPDQPQPIQFVKNSARHGKADAGAMKGAAP